MNALALLNKTIKIPMVFVVMTGDHSPAAVLYRCIEHIGPDRDYFEMTLEELREDMSYPERDFLRGIHMLFKKNYISVEEVDGTTRIWVNTEKVAKDLENLDDTNWNKRRGKNAKKNR